MCLDTTFTSRLLTLWLRSQMLMCGQMNKGELITLYTLCLKKRPNFETVQLEIIWIDFDDILFTVTVNTQPSSFCLQVPLICLRRMALYERVLIDCSIVQLQMTD